jgi:hypothetical protein
VAEDHSPGLGRVRPALVTGAARRGLIARFADGAERETL